MAKRVPRKTKTFSYEGEEFILRRPSVLEMTKITELISGFQRSVRTDKIDLVKQGLSEQQAELDATGNMNLTVELKRYVARRLALDPDTQENIFKTDAELDSEDGDFILAVWDAYTSPDKAKAASGDAPLETEATTTSSSEETSSESQSTSESIPTET